LVARNTEASRRCGQFERGSIVESSTEADSPPRKGVEGLGTFSASAPDGNQVICLRVKVDASSKGEIDIFLPRKHTNSGEPQFSEGRLGRLSLKPGSQTHGLVLPEYVRGQKLGFRLSGDNERRNTVAAVAFGEMASPGE
jgi:hypothetical protein